MKRPFIITSVLVAIAFGNVSATIINVPADYDTIQVAINASSDGDTVLVAEGHYYERINFYGKGILLTSEFMLDGDTLHIQNTIIDADTLVLGVADTGSVVCFVNGEDSTSVINGYTLQNGIGIIDSDNYRWGGGIHCHFSSPTISNNTISGNSANWFGGGIYCLGNSSPTIDNNTISGNSAGWGGGIYFNNSFPNISNNTINGNSADYIAGGICCWESSPNINNNTISGNSTNNGDGGGIFCWESSPYINNNTISGNSTNNGDGGGIFCLGNPSFAINNNTISGNSADCGGGIYCLYSNPIISNNTISGNSAHEGGGIYCLGNPSPIINNNTISGNYANWFGGGISCLENLFPAINNNTISGNSADCGGGIYCGESNPVVVNTILWVNIANSSDNEIYLYNSSISITYSDIQDTLWPGEGNIDADPLFCLSDTAYYWLSEISPCVGAGCDSLGNPDSTVNIGAYGIGCEEPQSDIPNGDNMLPFSLTLSQNYPNPFNASTTITFSIPKRQHVTLKIYDLLGREVQTLIDEDRQAGIHTVRFDASRLSSGIYFYRLQAGDYSESKRMVLLK